MVNTFNPNDLYLASGTAKLTNSWTANVTKFDTSSFYNFEQDNEPVFDLEERTDHLWEKIGYPIKDGYSGIPGVNLAVSAEAFESGGLYATSINENEGIVFKNLSSLIKVLPDPISYPIIVEVGSKGNLGTLDLNNLRFTDRGGLEIINRAYYKLDASEVYIGDLVPPDITVASQTGTNFQNTINGLKCNNINTQVYPDGFGSSQFEDNGYWYASKAPFQQNVFDVVTNNNAKTDKAYLSLPGDTKSVGTGPDFFKFQDTTDSISDAQFQFVNPFNGASEQRALATTGINVPVVGALYGNYFESVKIKGCDGPIFLRGFIVDGQRTTIGTGREIGFDIINSSPVLENCGALRCRKYGFNFSNSNPTIIRSIFSRRIYDIDGTDSTIMSTSSVAAAIRGVNSNLFISSTEGISSGMDNFFQCSYSKIGLLLENSYIGGGDARKQFATGQLTNRVSFLQTFYCEVGLKTNNSVIDYDGRIDSFNNFTNFELDNSVLRTNEIDCESSRDLGLVLNNSTFVYNKNNILYPNDQVVTQFPQSIFRSNGQHIKAKSSTIISPYTNQMPSAAGVMVFAGTIGANTNSLTETALPAIELDKTYAEFVHTKVAAQFSAPRWENDDAIYGAAIKATNGSKVKFFGSRNGVTFLLGPTGAANQQRVATVYAGNNSQIEFMGPTVIGQGFVGALAEDNSVVTFQPHARAGSLDVSGWDLVNSKNQTKVEIYSIGNCLVANKNSTINMFDLGDFNNFWPINVTSAVDYESDQQGLTPHTVSGYMQFYPLGQQVSIPDASANILPSPASIPSFIASLTTEHIFVDIFTGTPAQIAERIAGRSDGGICVKAVGNSVVNVRNVHFPTKWINPSGNFYDATDVNRCEHLRIWNICDSSKLNASYCSVSGLYPNQAGYFGPSALYPLNIQNKQLELDRFGLSGATPGTNSGPFRLYFSPDGVAKFFFYLSANNGVPVGFNAPYQMWAQDYNVSGPVSATGFVSGLGAQESLVGTSSIPTASAFLDGTGHNRIRLDESAADTFANAKNASIVRAGRVKMVSIYRNTVEPGGEANDGDKAGYGIGFKSSSLFDLKRSL